MVIARQFLVALRGQRSQVAWSRRLGYRSNVAYAWESGRRWPTAAEAFRACERAGIDVRAALSRFFGRAPTWLATSDPTTAIGVARLLEELRGPTSVTDLAKQSGLGRSSLSRWLSGVTEPRLPDFLHLVEAASFRLVDLLVALVEPASIPAIVDPWRRLEARRRGAGEAPWTQAILRVLELQEYRAMRAHEPGWIAARIGISGEEEARCLGLLRDSGQAVWTGTHFQPELRAVDTRQSAEVSRRLKAHWTRVAAERIDAGADGQFSYNVFAVSRSDFARLREAHLDYFRTLRAIVAESTDDDIVAVANVQLFALTGTPAKS